MIDNITNAAAAIRSVESSGDYQRQQRVRVNGQVDNKVGAYGLLESRFRTLATDLGYANANWRDRKMQDMIAKEKLTRDYKALGSWDLAVVAFRYGQPVAQQFKQKGYSAPKDVELAGYPEISNYMRTIEANGSARNLPVSGRLPDGPGPLAKKGPNPTRRRSEDIIRNQLVQQRDADRARAKTQTVADEEVSPQVGDLPDPAVEVPE
jgi:hypothetical protein